MKTPILPNDTQDALQKMTALTLQMIEITEQQTNYIALKQDVDFYTSVEKKNILSHEYELAIKEFQDRQKEFVYFGKSHLKELCQLHARLKTETLINMNFLEGVAKNPLG